MLKNTLGISTKNTKRRRKERRTKTRKKRRKKQKRGKRKERKRTTKLTTSNAMHLMLNKEIHQRQNRSKKAPSEYLPPLQTPRVPRTQGNTAYRPGYRGHQIGDHEYIMPIVIIRRRDICPTPTRYRPE